MKNILVAEDETAIREFVVINLERAGYNVTEADCGEAALETYEQKGGDFDIAILDIMMPGMDGLQVCKELRKRNGSIGIIMLTARTQEMDKVSGLMLGADDYVTKPFSPSELVARVDALYRRVAIAEMRTENNFKEEIGRAILLSISATIHSQSVVSLSTLHRLSFRLWNISFQVQERLLIEVIFSVMSGEKTMSVKKKSLMLIFAVCV